MIVGGILTSHKGMAFPTRTLLDSVFTEKDHRNLLFGIQHGMDLVGFSYIREAADIGRVKKILKKESTGIPIMAKIETQPHRAEVTDVVNAIYDGTDAIMVLEETTLGQFPIEAFQIMAKITPSAAEEFPRPLFLRKEVAVNLQQAISQAASFLAEGVGAEVVITPTESGSTTIRKFP